MTYASPALRRNPQEVSEHFINSFMLELLKCLAGSIYSKEYLLSKTLVQKPRAFLARLLAQEIEVSFPTKRPYIPDVRSIMTFR
ncbi:hypothetical protein FORC82_p185 (plasmid) [Escherichia coli]|nr:hypothetical protein FORC82_p185 [Escherichia coli]